MAPSYTYALPYNDDSADLMLALNVFEFPAFLDSAGYGGNKGQFDILAAAPVAHIKIEAGAVSSSDKESKLLQNFNCHSGELFNCIRELRRQYLLTSNETAANSPGQKFNGSVIGYLGYPALSGKANLLIRDAFIGVYLWAVLVDHSQQSCELQFHHSCSSTFRSKILSAVTTAMSKRAAQQLPALQLLTNFHRQLSRNDYQAAFDQIKSLIYRGDCYQVNLTQCFKAETSGHPLAAYLSLRKATAAPFSAYINWCSGALLSLSPERFLSLQDSSVLTQPIKGTRPRGSTDQQDRQLSEELSLSEKDRAENLMIVDLLRNDLGRVCKTGSIQANQLFEIESFSNVHHMLSTVKGDLAAGKDAVDLLQSCFPGGSITGAPKLSAMNIIEQLEADSRRVYCGTVFHLSAAGNLDSSITIRSLLWQPEQLLCWAGGGIVADSDCDQEYQECFDKINNIFSVLQS